MACCRAPTFPSVATFDDGGDRLHRLDRHDRQQRLLLVLDRSGHLLDDAGARSTPRRRATDEFLWAQAGSPGTLALGWYATERLASPTLPAGPTTRRAATTVKWFGYAGLITNATSIEPTVAQQRFTEKPMHYGQICNQGIGCTVSSGDRTMADYFAVQLRPQRRDAVRLQRHDEPAPWRAPVRGPRSSRARTFNGKAVKEAVPTNPMKDVAGDAQWPHYSPTGPGLNQPQLDFTNLALSQPSPSMLRVKMTLANLRLRLRPARRAPSG